MSDEESMIERVARAILREQEKEPFPNNLNLARAAIEAMREPTDAMVRANGTSPVAAGQRWLNEDARQTWRAMIDAALTEHANAR